MASNPYMERLKTLWERPGVKVMDTIPPGTRAHEVQSISYHNHEEARVVVQKNKILHLCSITKELAWSHVMVWKEEIKNRPEWVDRVESWEAMSSTEGYSFDVEMNLLKSRMTIQERSRIEAMKDPEPEEEKVEVCF